MYPLVTLIFPFPWDQDFNKLESTLHRCLLFWKMIFEKIFKGFSPFTPLLEFKLPKNVSTRFIFLWQHFLKMPIVFKCILIIPPLKLGMTFYFIKLEFPKFEIVPMVLQKI